MLLSFGWDAEAADVTADINHCSYSAGGLDDFDGFVDSVSFGNTAEVKLHAVSGEAYCFTNRIEKNLVKPDSSTDLFELCGVGRLVGLGSVLPKVN